MIETLDVNLQPLGALASEFEAAADRMVRAAMPDTRPGPAGDDAPGAAVAADWSSAPSAPPVPEGDRGLILVAVDHSVPFGQSGVGLLPESVETEAPSRRAETLTFQGGNLDLTRETVTFIRTEEAFQAGAAVVRTVEQTAGSIMNLWT